MLILRGMKETTEKSLDQLRPTANNPRILMQENAEKLDRSLDEMGPVDGIVMNVNPKINELVSGNQRTAKFKISGGKIILTHRFDEPTSTGTVAYGYVEVDGERWPYREVNWGQTKHNKGVLLANQHAGDEDKDLLAERYNELLQVDPDALDMLFITPEGVDALQDGWVDHSAEPEEDEGSGNSADVKSGKYSIKQLRVMRDSFSEALGRGDNGFVEWLADREND